MPKNEHGGGSVKAIRNRSTGAAEGYQALLPRAQSAPPAGCKNPSDYREPIGPPQPTREKAKALLHAALVELIERRSLRHGLTIGSFATAQIRSRLQDAKREYAHNARAVRSVATWRSIDKVWLSKTEFYDWPPSRVEIADLQRWFDWLRDAAVNKRGDPLSGNFIRNVAAFLRSIFERANIVPNPVDSVKLAARNEPRVSSLDLSGQRRLFQSEVPVEDLLMIGCGMGAGLRVGELLAMERADVFLDDADPHLMVRYGGDHHAPTKGRKVRRVELFEPGLGFWQLWIRHCYAGGVRVFAGPSDGYLKAWPERFPAWSEAAGKQLTSHIMRHSYAVAMLSGSWGYEPKSLEFVQQQLGHADRATTEKYYGAFEHGTWQREVRRMTGRQEKAHQREAVTALSLLRSGVSFGATPAVFAEKVGRRAKSPSLTQLPRNADKTDSNGALSPQSNAEPSEDEFLVAVAEQAERASAFAELACPYVARKSGGAR